jgi:hypothetical protein
MLIEGDGSSTVFIFALGNLYQISSGSAVPYGNLGAVPTGIVVSGIPPVPVTSVTIDGVGNITITLASALGAGIVLNFVFNLLFNSGDVSTFPAATLISGTVGISNFPVSQAVTLASTTITGTVGVTGAFFQATQPISGAISFTAPQHVINDASAAVIGHVINDASAAVIGHVISDTGSVVAVSNFPASQVVTLASTTITGNVAVTGAFFQATQPVSGAFFQATQPVSGAFFQAVQPVSGAFFQATQPVSGAFFQATQPVSVVSGTLTSVTAITNALPAGTNVLGHIIVDSGTITAVTAIINALPTGANTIGKVDILGNAGATLDAAINGAASTNALWAMHAPSTAAAAAMATPTTIAALTVANVKASAGNVYGISVNNTSGTPIFLQFYNTAGTPVLGTSVIFSIPCVIGITNIPIAPFAIANFATGIGIGASTSALSTGSPSVPPVVTIFFK